MTVFDGIVLVILVAAIVQGRMKGMAWQLAPIASLILGYVVAFPLADQLAPWFGDSAPMNHLLALLVLYVTVALGVYLLARSVKEYIVKFKLEEYDRHLGALFGGVKGLLFCLVVMLFAVAISNKARDYLLETRSGYAAAYLMDAMHPVMPVEVHDALEPYIHALDQDDMELKHRHDHDPADIHAHGERIATKPEDELLPPLPEEDFPHDGHHEQADDHTGEIHRHAETGDEVSSTNPTRQERVVDGVLKVLDILTDK